MTLSPIILFIYNRPNHTKQTLEALSNNTLASQSDLFIFADGPKNTASKEQLESIKQTRKVAASEKWCKSVTLIESETNKGLARSIIEGVTEIINKYGKAIILEDDIVTGKYFLEYMNTALDKYKDKKEVMHITGWHEPIKGKTKNPNDCFFYPVMDCWSWATWADRWQYFEKNTDRLLNTWTKDMIWRFNHDGTEPGMWSQVIENKEGKINTWAIYWYASIFEKNGLCLAPTKSLVKNIGFDNSGVHCGANPNEEITDTIDYQIINYPTIFRINKKEWCKIKRFNKMIHNKDSLSILKSILLFPLRVMKKILKSLGLLEPLKKLIKKV